MTTVTPVLGFDDGIREAIARDREVFGDVAVVSAPRPCGCRRRC